MTTACTELLPDEALTWLDSVSLGQMAGDEERKEKEGNLLLYCVERRERKCVDMKSRDNFGDKDLSRISW